MNQCIHLSAMVDILLETLHVLRTSLITFLHVPHFVRASRFASISRLLDVRPFARNLPQHPRSLASLNAARKR